MQTCTNRKIKTKRNGAEKRIGTHRQVRSYKSFIYIITLFESYFFSVTTCRKYAGSVREAAVVEAVTAKAGSTSDTR